MLHTLESHVQRNYKRISMSDYVDLRDRDLLHKLAEYIDSTLVKNLLPPHFNDPEFKESIEYEDTMESFVHTPMYRSVWVRCAEKWHQFGKSVKSVQECQNNAASNTDGADTTDTKECFKHWLEAMKEHFQIIEPLKTGNRIDMYKQLVYRTQNSHTHNPVIPFSPKHVEKYAYTVLSWLDASGYDKYLTQLFQLLHDVFEFPLESLKNCVKHYDATRLQQIQQSQETTTTTSPVQPNQETTTTTPPTNWQQVNTYISAVIKQMSDDLSVKNDKTAPLKEDDFWLGCVKCFVDAWETYHTALRNKGKLNSQHNENQTTEQSTRDALVIAKHEAIARDAFNLSEYLTTTDMEQVQRFAFLCKPYWDEWMQVQENKTPKTLKILTDFYRINYVNVGIQGVVFRSNSANNIKYQGSNQGDRGFVDHFKDDMFPKLLGIPDATIKSLESSNNNGLHRLNNKASPRVIKICLIVAEMHQIGKIIVL